MQEAAEREEGRRAWLWAEARRPSNSGQTGAVRRWLSRFRAARRRPLLLRLRHRLAFSYRRRRRCPDPVPTAWPFTRSHTPSIASQSNSRSSLKSWCLYSVPMVSYQLRIDQAEVVLLAPRRVLRHELLEVGDELVRVDPVGGFAGPHLHQLQHDAGVLLRRLGHQTHFLPVISSDRAGLPARHQGHRCGERSDGGAAGVATAAPAAPAAETGVSALIGRGRRSGPGHHSLVRDRLKDVDTGRATRRQDRGEHADDHRHHEEDGELQPGNREDMPWLAKRAVIT